MAWTEKYRPKSLDEVIGNENHIEMMKGWIKEFKKNPRGTKKILLISGPPGVGKTTIAHLLLKDHGYRVLEYNASDSRKGKTLKEILTKSVGRHNVMDMMYGRPQSTGLVLDEIDGLKGNDKDRGGLGELIKFIESKKGKTVYTPIICTYNPFSSKFLTKLKKLGVVVRLKKSSKYQCQQLVKRIADAEKIPLDDGAQIQIVKHLLGDMRLIVNALWLMHLEAVEEYDEAYVKKFMKHFMKKDKNPQLYDSVQRVLRDESITPDQCMLINSLDLQIPLLLHENYPQVIAGASDKFIAHEKIMNGIVQHDILQNVIFKNHDWSLNHFCALINLYGMNRLVSYRKMTRQLKINSADSLNKIQQSKTNLKAINNIMHDLKLTMSEEDLTNLAEILCALLFDRVKKNEMPSEEQVNKILEILKNYGFSVEDITNIIRLNRYNSTNYSFGGKYKRHIIVHILRCRLREDSSIDEKQIEGLLKIMCPYFTGKSSRKDRLKKIFKAFGDIYEEDVLEKNVMHLLRDELIRSK